MLNLDQAHFEAECPKCGYPVEFSLLDARLESRVFCPNCKSRIHLQDVDGSVHAAREQVQNALNDLAKAFRRLGK